MKFAFLIITIGIVLSSCEKAINFNLSQSAPQLVVDASIENSKAPVVILSSSLNYFSEITPQLLEQTFVHGASVLISNGTKTQQLKEYSIPADSSGTALYYYSIDSSQAGNIFTGTFNTTYSLTITSEAKTYTAQTTIPTVARKIDSVWWKVAPDNPDTSKVVIIAKTTDPTGYGNYIRYFTSVNDGPFLPGLNSVFDDQIVDGTTYSIQLEKGVNRNEKIDFENYSFFNRGDSVKIRLCNIDKATFDFWRTLEYSYQSIGNPFSSPGKVLGNISNGALGYFGGYAAQYVSLNIPK